MADLIELEGVGRDYGQQEGAAGVAALADVSLRIEAGEFICITGPSGSGKTTLLNILGCLDSPTSGSYRFSGREVSSLGPDALAWVRREAIGFVFQSSNLLDAASAIENVELPAVYAGVPGRERRERAAALLAEAGLEDRAEHGPSELSGGEQQRVAIARALMNGGRLILADEPTGALDRSNSKRTIDELESLARRGHTVVIASHSKDIAERTDRLIELRDGRVVKDSGRAASPGDSGAAAHGGERPAGGSGSRGGNLLRSIADAFAVLRSEFLRRKRLQAAMSLTGVAVATWWLLTLTAVVDGITREGLRQIGKHDGSQISLMATLPLNGPPPVPLTIDEARVIEESVANVRSAMPMVNKQHMTVSSESISMQANVGGNIPREGIYGGDADLYQIAEGSPLTELDSERSESVAVIGPGVAAKLFPSPQDAIGSYVAINGLPFRVKGVSRPIEVEIIALTEDPEWEEIMRASREDFVNVPLRTAINLFYDDDRVTQIWIWVDDPEIISETAQDIGDLLIRRHGQVSFEMYYSARTIEEGMQANRLILGFGYAIGLIALVGSGLGVMSVMLMSVTGRRREIGLRMAVGARRADVRKQFLLESAAVVVTGGLLGVAASAACLALFGWFGPSWLGQMGVPAMLSGWSALAILVVVAGAGVLCGLLPAQRAAATPPAEAIADT